MKKLILLLFIPLVFTCSSDSSDDSSPCPNQPQLTTNEVSDISVDAVTGLVSATLSGEILNIQLGDNCETFSITNQGFVYSTSIQPTIEDNVVNANGEIVTVSLNGLSVETTYYVRTFITNVLGTFYGNEVLFTTPESESVPINEEEVITTMIVTLVGDGDGSIVTMQFRDLDGNGPDIPVITVSAPIWAGQSYSGSIVWLNETEDPAENITLEIVEEAEDYQVFYSNGGVEMEFYYTDFDSNGDFLGTQFTLNPLYWGSGSVTITLVHEPMKPNNDLESAGGEISFQATFDIEISN